jgi:bifunctional UDP-N-acetylglucosamine pyrophosphorylase/glucosamine-1-phosphate N-acetyltransferase
MAGAFAFGKEILPHLINAPGVMTHVPVGGMPPLESELAEVYANLIDAHQDIACVVTQKPTADLDKCWHIFDATRAVLQEMSEALTESRIAPTASISEGAEISGHIVVEEGATIGRRVVLEGPAWIGKNTRVINGAIVGKGVVIGGDTRISDYCLLNGGTTVGKECVLGHGGEMDGVMLDGSYIYHYSEIFGVLGLSVDIGAATVCGTLRFDDGNTIHRLRGRRELPRTGSNATYFGDYSRTGVNVITQPGTKIGTYSCVGAGVVLYEDIPDRKLVLLKQETVVRDWGPERYGW